MVSQITITDLAYQHVGFSILLYWNFFCVIVLAVGDLVCMGIYYKEWGHSSYLPLLTVLLIVEVVDFVLNVIEDLILKCYARGDPTALLRMERPLPGLGCCGIVTDGGWN